MQKMYRHVSMYKWWENQKGCTRTGTVAEQNVWGEGGQLGRANLGGSEGKPLKIFEIFIPEITPNVSNFEN